MCMIDPSPCPSQAFSVAERELSIAPMLKPTEMANADPLGLLSYLTQFQDVLHDREVVGKPPEKKAIQKATKSDSQLLGKCAASSRNAVPLRQHKESKVCCYGRESEVGWACLNMLWGGHVQMCCEMGVSERAVGWVCLSVLWGGHV